MERVTVVEVGPLSLGAMHRLLVDARGHSFSRPALRRIVETSGGNPFYAIELARATDAGEEAAPGEPMPLPDSLEALLADRLTTLPAPRVRYLSVAAAASEPTIPLLDAAMGGDTRGALQPALEAGLVRVDAGRIAFAHPLLASAAYALDGMDRLAIHARLADLSTNVEERARHRALASHGPGVRSGVDADGGRTGGACARSFNSRR